MMLHSLKYFQQHFWEQTSGLVLQVTQEILCHYFLAEAPIKYKIVSPTWLLNLFQQILVQIL